MFENSFKLHSVEGRAILTEFLNVIGSANPLLRLPIRLRELTLNNI